jgi:acyl-CoA thioesterase-1
MKNNTPLLSRRAALLRLSVAVLVISFLSSPARADSPQPIRVACVGDSITYGAGLKDRHNESYPSCLGRWMGPEYDVRNFGKSGATLLHAGNLPYIKQSQHDKALAFKPDVVVIMLGTNDSKHPGGGAPPNDKVIDNWQYKADFVSDYEALIAEFRAANPEARIYVCYPTPCFPGGGGIDDKTIHDEICPLVHVVARNSRAKIIDFYQPLSGKAGLFPDTIHPNADGAKVMAAVVYHALTGKNAPN